jgi:hypothetical protein
VSLEYTDRQGRRYAGLQVVDRSSVSLGSLAALFNELDTAKTEAERAAIGQTIGARGGGG